MPRTAIHSALILRSRPSGESNSDVHLLTAEEGIIRATLFGGAKSKLRAHCAPYNSGQVWLYRDPAKDYGKISDFDVHSWRPGLRELYERTMAAGAVAETILASHGGGGDWAAALKLALSTLDALENASEELCSRLFVQFLWRWADFLGLQPCLNFCADCGAAVSSNNEVWFFPNENSMLCAACSSALGAAYGAVNGNNRRTLVQLHAGCRRWLAAAGELQPSVLHRYSLDNKSFDEAKTLTSAIMTEALGKRLASWDW